MRIWKTLPSFAHPDGTDMWKFGSWPMDYKDPHHTYIYQAALIKMPLNSLEHLPTFICGFDGSF